MKKLCADKFLVINLNFITSQNVSILNIFSQYLCSNNIKAKKYSTSKILISKSKNPKKSEAQK